VKLLSLRLDHEDLKDISAEAKLYVSQATTDKTVGIRRDRRIFLSDMPSAAINKVCMYNMCF